ncbi:MAG TPA: HDIG domain-containing protein [Nitrososphaerales archaeon]|nr:HDIG domain-containing protein [Nitrososphaerales archaeon]
MIPSEGEAIALHRKYGSDQVIIEHCETVARVAKVLAEAFENRGRQVDLQAVVSAAMLHDIGRSKTHTISHGIEGSQIVEKEGADKKVVEIVRKHVGAGIAPEESIRLGLPDLDYIPRTLEEKIVCFADKMVDRNKVRSFEEEVRRFRIKSHDVGRLLALKESLQRELGEDPEKLIFEKLKASQ